MKITGRLFELDHQYKRLILEITPEQMERLQKFLESTLLYEFQGFSPLVPDYNLVKITKVNNLPDFDPLEPITVTCHAKPYNFPNYETESFVKGVSFQFQGLTQSE